MVWVLVVGTCRASSQSYIAPGGITEHEWQGGGGGLDVRAIQAPTNLDYCFAFLPEGFPLPAQTSNASTFNVCLDEGVRAFLVASNDPISLQPLMESRYTELRVGENRVFQPGVSVCAGFYTGFGVFRFTNGETS